MASDDTMISFYQLLGRVFYAVAMADKKVEKNEILALKQLVKEVWLDVDNTVDEFESDAAFQIEIVFDYLLNNTVEADVLKDLKTFKSHYPSIFTPNMIERIMDTSYKIASAFAKRNKSELVFLSQLRFLLTD